jgi:hypothetical protein
VSTISRKYRGNTYEKGVPGSEARSYSTTSPCRIVFSVITLGSAN